MYRLCLPLLLGMWLSMSVTADAVTADPRPVPSPEVSPSVGAAKHPTCRSLILPMIGLLLKAGGKQVDEAYGEGYGILLTRLADGRFSEIGLVVPALESKVAKAGFVLRAPCFSDDGVLCTIVTKISNTDPRGPSK